MVQLSTFKWADLRKQYDLQTVTSLLVELQDEEMALQSLLEAVKERKTTLKRKHEELAGQEESRDDAPESKNAKGRTEDPAALQDLVRATAAGEAGLSPSKPSSTDDLAHEKLKSMDLGGLPGTSVSKRVLAEKDTHGPQTADMVTC